MELKKTIMAKYFRMCDNYNVCVCVWLECDKSPKVLDTSDEHSIKNKKK